VLAACAVAARGTSSGAGSLPHLDVIQKAFGKYDVSGVRAHTGGAAAEAAAGLNAKAYATGDHVVLGEDGGDLFTVVHEAVHTLQQRAGIGPAAGIDQGRNDPLEQQANEIAEAVVRGESAEPLLDKYIGDVGGGGGGRGVAAVQRFGNDPDNPAIANIYQGQGTPQERMAALLQSNSPLVTYGTNARDDEEAEITASASYLQERKRDWRAELQNRQQGHQPQWQAWETFQYEMGRVTPGVDPNQTPWFMQNNIGYALNNAHNQQQMQIIGNMRAAPAQDDPQQLLGMSYQRDTMYTIEDNVGSPILNHQGTFDVNTTAQTVAGWTNDVLRIVAGNDELRIRITGAVAGIGQVTVSGTVLPGPQNNGGFGVGTTAQVRTTQATGAVTLHDGTGALRHTVAAGNWTGRLESYAYHQARTRVNEGIGGHVNGARQEIARNRGPAVVLDDTIFQRVDSRYHSDNGDADRGYAQTLGPWRTRLNFRDEPMGDPEVGWDIEVAPYRRLGGDSIFTEAVHPPGGHYQNQLLPANQVNVNDPLWYYNQAASMPNRFVGGRSNSTALYMSSATMLYHANRLSLEDAKDVLAFVIADMVVSGEHSMPECMTTVVMAAGSAEPWTNTPLNLAGATPTLRAWMLLVNDPTKAAMRLEAHASLLRMLGNPHQDLRLVKVMTMLLKELS
jgi:hypothetical protein